MPERAFPWRGVIKFRIGHVSPQRSPPSGEKVLGKPIYAHERFVVTEEAKFADVSYVHLAAPHEGWIESTHVRALDSSEEDNYDGEDDEDPGETVSSNGDTTIDTSNSDTTAVEGSRAINGVQESQRPQDQSLDQVAQLPQAVVANKDALKDSTGIRLSSAQSKHSASSSGSRHSGAPQNAQPRSKVQQKIRYLPKTFNGEPVLIHEGPQRYRLDDTDLQSNVSGILWRLSKDLRDIDKGLRAAMFGASYIGTDTGDGWVKVVLPQKERPNMAADWLVLPDCVAGPSWIVFPDEKGASLDAVEAKSAKPLTTKGNMATETYARVKAEAERKMRKKQSSKSEEEASPRSPRPGLAPQPRSPHFGLSPPPPPAGQSVSLELVEAKSSKPLDFVVEAQDAETDALQKKKAHLAKQGAARSSAKDSKRALKSTEELTKQKQEIRRRLDELTGKINEAHQEMQAATPRRSEGSSSSTQMLAEDSPDLSSSPSSNQEPVLEADKLDREIPSNEEWYEPEMEPMEPEMEPEMEELATELAVPDPIASTDISFSNGAVGDHHRLGLHSPQQPAEEPLEATTAETQL